MGVEPEVREADPVEDAIEREVSVQKDQACFRGRERGPHQHATVVGIPDLLLGIRRSEGPDIRVRCHGGIGDARDVGVVVPDH